MTPRTSAALHLKCAASAASCSQLLCFNIFGVPSTLPSNLFSPGSSDWLRPFCAIAWQFAVLPVAAVPPDQKRMWHLCGGNGICMQLNLWLWRGVYLDPAFASSGWGWGVGGQAWWWNLPSRPLASLAPPISLSGFVFSVSALPQPPSDNY